MKKYIGDKKFYGMVLSVSIPIIIQNAITNFVGLLDNIMVGRIGTEQMSGVAIVNQLLFVYNLALFGAVSGPGIFTAQYVGQKNSEGVKQTVRIKLYMVFVIALLGLGILLGFDDQLISLFLHENNEGLNLAATLSYAKNYLYVMAFGLFPFAITQAYSGTLREDGETKVPMIAGLVAVGANLILNLILIFGLLGAPKLGIIGAAIATVISRFIELFIVVIWTHSHKERNTYIVGLYRHFFSIPSNLAWKILKTGTPLFINEFLWALGMSALTQCYSTRGLDVIAAFNISNTIVNLFNVAFISLGSTVSIIVGQILGSGNIEEVVDTDNKLIAFSVFTSAVLTVILIAFSPLFPKFYNTTDEIRALATKLMIVSAIYMPVNAYLNAAYFTIRSGGKTFITFLFDSAFLWVISFPVAFVISRFTNMLIIPMYFVILALDFIKVFIGHTLIKKKIWINDLVA